MHVDHDAVDVAGGGADEQVLHQPAVFFGAGFELRHSAEIDQLGIDGLAALQPLQQLDGAETNALVLDIDDRAVVGLEGIFRFQFDQLIGPDDLEVRAERADLAVDIAAHLAAGNRNDAADAVTDIADGCHAADIGGDGENVFGRKPRRHELPHHALWQPGRQQRKQDQDHQPDEVGRHERDHAPENRGKRHVLDDALDHEDVHPDRWMDQAEFHRHHDDDAEPDRIEAEMGDHRKDDRHGQNDHRHRVHQAAEHQIHHHDQGEHAVTAETEAGEKLRDLLRGLRHREEISKDQGADQHRKDSGGR